VQVITRHRVSPERHESFMTEARAALHELAKRPGYERGGVGRATDDGDLFAVWHTWSDVGFYRRALGAFEVKMVAIPLLSTAIDEPSAYEVLHSLVDGVVTETETRLAE
jgi:hypothetical protein